MKILIENNQNKVTLDKRLIRRNTAKLLKFLDCTDKEISLVFVDNETIRKLNKQYLSKDRPTNVLSFSLQEGDCGNINPLLLGDVVISVETAQRDAAAGGLTLTAEINFLIIHGLLHLLGYNHEGTTRAEANKMRQKEKELFNQLSASITTG